MEFDIFDYGMNGEGVAKLDGKIFLINNALIGETVEANIEQTKSNYAVGSATKIIKTSNQRTNPPCPYFFECGGCDLQHMSYTEQLEFKTLLVKKTIKKIANLNCDVLPTIASDNQFNYRNKISFNCNGFDLGFFKEKSNNIVKIEHCCLATDNTNKILKLFKEYIITNNINFVKKLVVRDIENQILVGIVTKQHFDCLPFFDILKKHFKDVGLFEIVNTRKDSVVLAGKVNYVGGIKQIKLEQCGIKYAVDLMGFQQTNLNIQNKLYDFVNDNINKNEVVVNGFSGQGLLTAVLAKKSNFVFGIEINKSSHKSAEDLIKANNIKNVKNVCGDFFVEMKKLKDFNTVVLDPAKKGCGEKVLNLVKNAQKIVYVSCNPIALSKDLKILTQFFKITKIQPFDMFPNTKSVETVVVLEK